MTHEPSPYIAVCGKCNIPIELHPVPSCPYAYKATEGYGWMMTLLPERKKTNGLLKEKKEKRAA